jgi:hypothetical protein
MALQSDFNPDEWRILRDALTLVTVAMSAASPSGFMGTFREALAPGNVVREALQGTNDLLKALCERSQLRMAGEDLREEIPRTDLETFRDQVIREAKTHCRTGMAILERKGFSEDRLAYGQFLMQVAMEVAKAAREPSPTGYEEDPISDPERLLLSEFATLLEQPADGILQA